MWFDLVFGCVGKLDPVASIMTDPMAAVHQYVDAFNRAQHGPVSRTMGGGNGEAQVGAAQLRRWHEDKSRFGEFRNRSRRDTVTTT